MAGGQRAPGTQGGASGPGPDRNTTDESTRTSMKRGPQTTGTTPEPKGPKPPTLRLRNKAVIQLQPPDLALPARATPVLRKPSQPLNRVMLARPPPFASLMVHRTMERGPPGREAKVGDAGIRLPSGNKPVARGGRVILPSAVKARTVASQASPADPRGIPNQRARLVRGPSPPSHGQVIRIPKGRCNLTRPQGRNPTRPKGRTLVSLSRSRKRHIARPLGPAVVVILLLPPRPLMSKSGT